MFVVTQNTPFDINTKSINLVENAVKWRKPSIPGAPNPLLVIFVNHAIVFKEITINSNEELFLAFGAALPKISEDGLDIIVSLRNKNNSIQLIYQAHVTNNSTWIEQWISLPQIAFDKVDLIIECGPGPNRDSRADWLALSEIFIGTRKSYSLLRARLNKEIRTKNEIANFSRTYRMPMFTTKAKQNAFAHAQAIIQRESIKNPINLFGRARSICSNNKIKILTICCGSARIEESLFRAVAIKPHITLVDINHDLLELASHRMREIADTSIICGDANEIKLPENEFDVAICVSGLHHIVELEHLISQLSKSLKPNGEFWSIGEYVGRNNARLWPESYDIADQIFSSLPNKYRVNNITNNKPIDAHLSNIDCSATTFEGIRAEDIIDVLDEYFISEHVDRWSTIAWRIIGPAYVDNYNISNPDDRRAVEEIAHLDVKYLTSGCLRPVGLRGIYRPK